MTQSGRGIVLSVLISLILWACLAIITEPLWSHVSVFGLHETDGDIR